MASVPPHENPAAMIFVASTFAYAPVPALFVTQSTAAFMLAEFDVPPPLGAPSAMARKPYEAMFWRSAELEVPTLLQAPLPQMRTGSFSLPVGVLVG
jgi:hypothetical protein